MHSHLYVLQALLYNVALHRYLSQRLPDYDYCRHFGGSLYLFVRAVRPAWRNDGVPAGVWCDRPPQALIEALDRLMRGETP
jgi:exodeoxyribonuclease V beta subunit